MEWNRVMLETLVSNIFSFSFQRRVYGYQAKGPDERTLPHHRYGAFNSSKKSILV